MDMMKYKVWVNLGGEMQGEYDGEEYDSYEEADAIVKMLWDDLTISAWIEEVYYE
jgi:hypothetical protein